MIRYVFWPLIALLSFGKIDAQVITTRPGADTMKVVTLINADRLSYKRPDSLTDLQMLAGNVQLRQENTLINCDSAVFNKKTRYVEAFGNVHIIDNDTVNIRSQYLQYYVDTKMAYLKNNVSLTDSKSTLLTNELQYDLNTKIGEYHNGGKLINKQSVLTSKEGTYYEELKDVYFKKDVDLKDPQYSLKTDSLLYNTETQIATFIAPTTIIDSSKRTINTSDGFYDTRNRKAYFAKRPILKDGAVTIIANSIDSNDSLGLSLLRGNAVYIDTAQGVSVLANFIEANRDDGTFRATQHPLMIIKQDKDSIFITADTLYSGRLSKLPGYKDSSSHQTDTAKRISDTAAQLAKAPVKRIDPAALADDTVKRIADTTALAKDPVIKVTDTTLLAKDSAIKITDTATLAATPVKRKTDTALVKGPATKKPGKAGSPAVASKPVKAAKPAKATRENKNDSTDRYFQAWHHVRIYSDSMQAVSDSLFYSGKDSVFQLYTDPVMWASNSQITGDTIFLYTKNKNPDRLFVFENGFAVNLSDTLMYNQIKGNRLNGYFKNGEIEYMRATGNAESIYYVKDEKNYLVGINNATSDIIDMRFKNKELNKVVFISEVSGTMYPVRQATEENKKLRNFKWLEDRRPKSKFELYEDIKPVVIKDSLDLVDSLEMADSLSSQQLVAPPLETPKQAPKVTPGAPQKTPQKEPLKERPLFRHASKDSTKQQPKTPQLKNRP
ncbi:OstA-like protein [Longitalea luteola]|uniref:OstA-like protein n=1 Tax=Longitalea luteola TaxID=2812563 RepID=UPI001A963035|nr:OstA-like protein [Longitalea luteola]